MWDIAMSIIKVFLYRKSVTYLTSSRTAYQNKAGGTFFSNVEITLIPY